MESYLKTIRRGEGMSVPQPGDLRKPEKPEKPGVPEKPGSSSKGGTEDSGKPLPEPGRSGLCRDGKVGMGTNEPPHWYVLTVLRSGIRACDRVAASVEEFNARSGAQLECFAPTFIDMASCAGRPGRIRKPLLYNYIFIRGTLQELRRFHTAHPVYNLLPIGEKREAATDYRYVPDPEMAHFKQIARAYENAVPCYPPSEIDLEHGDKVRIIGGQFSGVEGVLLSQQGRDGGRVLVKITDMLAVETLDIRPEYLQIIEFAHGSKHLYDKLDSYLPRIRRVLAARLLRKEPEPKDLASVHGFLARYGNVTLPPAAKIRRKYTALLMLSHHVLGRTAEYERCRQTCMELLPQTTHAETRAMTLGMLYACTRELRWLQEARAIVAGWGDPSQYSPAQRTIAEELATYERAAEPQQAQTPAVIRH